MHPLIVWNQPNILCGLPCHRDQGMGQRCTACTQSRSLTSSDYMVSQLYLVIMQDDDLGAVTSRILLVMTSR